MTDRDFVLNARLAADTFLVADWVFSRVLLMDDARFPWLILVPRRNGLREIHDLPAVDQSTLIADVARASRMLEAEFRPRKINVGALGNIVSQLHVHVVARSESDAAWPGPVWGNGTRVPYAEGEAERRITGLKRHL